MLSRLRRPLQSTWREGRGCSVEKVNTHSKMSLYLFEIPVVCVAEDLFSFIAIKSTTWQIMADIAGGPLQQARLGGCL
jgi:hypothetical protein